VRWRTTMTVQFDRRVETREFVFSRTSVQALHASLALVRSIAVKPTDRNFTPTAPCNTVELCEVHFLIFVRWPVMEMLCSVVLR